MELRIETLGRVSLMRDGQAVGQTLNAKTLALLIYLAVTAQAHSREQLADLLWGEMPEREAQINLRKALSLLRPSADAYLIIEKSTVAFDRTLPYWLDVQALASGAWRDTPVSGLRSLLSLYSGEFLAGFTVKHAPEFEVWALEQREHCRALEIKLAEFVVERAWEAGATDTALDALNRLLALDAWNEHAHRQKMLLLARRGEKLQALAQYQTARKTLADEFGVEPTPETTALYERIRDAEPLGGALPVFPTPFIGRAAERAALEALLREPATRLITLFGPGGIGKTRLALEIAAAQRKSFLHGVAYVPLQEATPMQLALAIGAAVNFSFSRYGEPLAQLAEFLRDKELVLVLDAFEHLVAAAPDVARLLENAPALKMLVTSRERLALQWEQVFELRGLSFPQSQTASHNLADHAREYDALQLFGERARRLAHDFELTGAQGAAVVQIARTVEGMPLALELAAGLTRALSCQEIATTLERNLTALESTLRDAPERQRSLRAVFQQSWRLLSETERTAAARLAVLRGTFDENAAQALADAPRALLNRLSDKALLRRAENQRYAMHAFLRELALEELERQPDAARAAQQRHGEYFMDFLYAQRAEMIGSAQAQTTAALRVEFANLRAAWQWTVAQNDVARLDATAPVLYRFLETTSQFREAESLFEPAIELSFVARIQYGGVQYFLGNFDQATAELERGLAQAHAAENFSQIAFCHICLGNVAFARAEYDRAQEHYTRALEWARNLADAYLQLDALNNLGTAAAFRGDTDQARPLYIESRELAARIGDTRGIAIAWQNLGMLDANRGAYAVARDAFERALPLFEQTGDQRGMNMSWGNLGEIALHEGRLDDAERLYRQSLEGYQHIAMPDKVAHQYRNLGTIALQRNDAAEAQRLSLNALAIYRRIGSRHGETAALNALGDALRAQNDYAHAEQNYRAALQLAKEINALPRALDALCGMAQLAAQRGDQERAVEMFTLVAHHAATDGDARRAAREQLDTLEKKMSAALFAQAAARGNQTELVDSRDFSPS